MKKIIAMLIACLMVVALVPVIAVPAAAAEKVVFVGKDGTGDGSAADKPLGNLIDAFAAIGDEDGTIVLVNMYDHAVEHDIPVHAGHVTVTSKYNGTDYNGGIYASQTAHLALGGDTTFENMNILIAKTTWLIRARFSHVTFGEGMNISNEANPNALSGLYIVGADQKASSPFDHSKDTHITIKSGNFTEVIGGSRSIDNGDMTGKVKIEVTGDARIGKLAYGTRSLSSKVNLNTALVVLDGGVIDSWVASGDKATTGFLGDVEVVLTKNFDISKSFNVARLGAPDANGHVVFFGISGSSAFQDCIPATLFANATLLVDPSIKAAVDATDKLELTSFTTVKEYTYVGTIGSGTLDAATAPEVPTTQAPTTEAPAASDDSYVVIDHNLLTEDCLDLFTGFGCTPELKVIDGKVVGLGMAGATSAMGYPYLRFGDESWKDYTIEFTAHGMNRVGGFIRSTTPLAQLDGYGGMCVGFEGLNTPGTFRSIYSVVNVEQNKSVIQENANGEKASFAHNLTDFNDSIRFVITIVGEDVTASMTYNDENGQPVTQSITAKCDKFDKTQGAAGLRAVFRQVNGEQANGYFTDLKVTLLGDTAKEWKAAHPETAAPATDAPAVDTTVAPATPEVTPSTGDATAVVFAISAACLVAAAAMVFLKKRIAE